MNYSAPDYFRAVWMSLIEPADMGRKVLNQNVPQRELWLALLLLIILNVLLRAFTRWLMPEVAAFQDQFVIVSHFGVTLVLSVFTVGVTYAVLHAGRALGGTANLHQALTLMVWFQVVVLTLEVAQLGITLIFPALGALYGVLMLGGLLWCILNFVDVMHGFGSLAKSAVTLVLAIIASLIVIPFALTLFGIGQIGASG